MRQYYPPPRHSVNRNHTLRPVAYANMEEGCKHLTASCIRPDDILLSSIRGSSVQRDMGTHLSSFRYLTVGLTLAYALQPPDGGPGRLKSFLESNPGAVVERNRHGGLESAQAVAEAFAVTAYDPEKPKKLVRGLEVRLKDGEYRESFLVDFEEFGGFLKAMEFVAEGTIPSDSKPGGIGTGIPAAPFMLVTWYRDSQQTGLAITKPVARGHIYKFPGLHPSSVISLFESAEAYFKSRAADGAGRKDERKGGSPSR